VGQRLCDNAPASEALPSLQRKYKTVLASCSWHEGSSQSNKCRRAGERAH